MTDTPTQRLFFALRPDRAVRNQIVALTAGLIPAYARPVTIDNLHITLAFLGSVDAAVKACVEQAAERVASVRFDVMLEQIGHWRRPKVLWLGPVDVPEALARLETSLETELASCGFSADEKSYRPHVTLARKVTGQLLPRRIDPVVWRVDGFCLMESKTWQEGVEYRVLREWGFDPGM